MNDLTPNPELARIVRYLPVPDRDRIAEGLETPPEDLVQYQCLVVVNRSATTEDRLADRVLHEVNQWADGQTPVMDRLDQYAKQSAVQWWIDHSLGEAAEALPSDLALTAADEFAARAVVSYQESIDAEAARRHAAQKVATQNGGTRLMLVAALTSIMIAGVCITAGLLAGFDSPWMVAGSVAIGAFAGRWVWEPGRIEP